MAMVLMQIDVKLFAIARQRVGSSTVQVSLPSGAVIRELRRALAEQYPVLAEALPHMRFAINNDYVTDDAIVSAAAEVACIPPVSGG